MDDRRTLMAAIIANPDEDTPRLVLADWLQEHGDKHDQARAEFIRLQIQCENAPPGKRRDELKKQAKELVKKHRKKWLAPLGMLWGIYLNADVDQFSRGLLSYLFVEVGPFLSKLWQSRLPEALATVGVEELSFWSATKRPAALADSDAIRWIARLEYPDVDDATLAVFARSENFAHISGLLLNEVKATDAGLRDFAKHTRTTNLTTINLAAAGSRNAVLNYSSKGVLALLTSDRLPVLTSLELGTSTGTEFGLRGFLANPAINKLKKLSLNVDATATEVITCQHLTGLRSLQLHKTEMTEKDVDPLLASKTFRKLQALYLHLPQRLPAASVRKLNQRFGELLTIEYQAG